MTGADAGAGFDDAVAADDVDDVDAPSLCVDWVAAGAEPSPSALDAELPK